LLVVISAPSGGGKTTIVKRILSKNDNFQVSVSCTTRGPRPGETDGVHYYFESEERFRSMADAGAFAEWASVHGNLYGTPVSEIERLWSQGKDILFDIDVQGGINLKRKYPGRTLLIFIMPPGQDVLEKRLRLRGTDDEKTVEKRLKNAVKEISIAKENYDYFVINDVLDEAVDRIEGIVRTFRKTTGGLDE